MKGWRGFSLVELMVALLVMGVLLGGLGQVHGSCLQACNRIHEGLRLQRALRLAQARVTDEFRMIGYGYPIPGRTTSPLFLPDLRAEEASFVRDVPLATGAFFAADLPAPHEGDALAVTSVRLRADPGGTLEAGDLLVTEDGSFEWATLAAPATLPRNGTTTVALAPPGLRAAHRARGRVALVRPRRAVRFAVVRMPLEGASTPVPCLVRFEAPLPPGGGMPAWTGLLARPRAGPGGVAVVAEQITGFQVEVMQAGPWPERHPGALQGEPGEAKAEVGERNAEAGEPNAEAGEPLGCSPIPPLLRVTLVARSSMRRAEFGRGGQGDEAAYLYRSLTWMVAPHHARLGRPP